MKISFSGAQSTGKTTLLNKCKEIYSDFTFVDEVTRKVNREHGVKINESGGNDTQLLILSEHIKNHMLSGNVILDRCILDGYVYTKYLNNTHKVSENILSMFELSLDCLLEKVDYILYTDPADVVLTDDGIRSTNTEFRNTIISIFNNVIEYRLNSQQREKIIKLSGTVNERLRIIDNVLNKDL